jgi:hypothetical protein
MQLGALPKKTTGLAVTTNLESKVHRCDADRMDHRLPHPARRLEKEGDPAAHPIGRSIASSVLYAARYLFGRAENASMINTTMPRRAAAKEKATPRVRETEQLYLVRKPANGSFAGNGFRHHRPSPFSFAGDARE